MEYLQQIIADNNEAVERSKAAKRGAKADAKAGREYEKSVKKMLKRELPKREWWKSYLTKCD